MKLQALQRRMARAVMTPLTPSERMRSLTPKGRSMRAEAAAFIRPNDRLTSFERLEIYNRQYWFRIFSAMTDDFPGLRAVLGDRLFDALSKAYLRDCPSTSFTCLLYTSTYRDPEVRRLMRERYLAVKVDQDSRPDLSNRYEDYGWPATVVFDSSGQEIIKRQGYLEPKQRCV